MNRRNFLKSMIAVASAPAIVKAENIMKVWVPPEKKLIVGQSFADLVDELDEAKTSIQQQILKILGENNQVLAEIPLEFKAAQHGIIEAKVPASAFAKQSGRFVKAVIKDSLTMNQCDLSLNTNSIMAGDETRIGQLKIEANIN